MHSSPAFSVLISWRGACFFTVVDSHKIAQMCTALGPTMQPPVPELSAVLVHMTQETPDSASIPETPAGDAANDDDDLVKDAKQVCKDCASQGRDHAWGYLSGSAEQNTLSHLPLYTAQHRRT